MIQTTDNLYELRKLMFKDFMKMGYKYIARDKDGAIFAYSSKPKTQSAMEHLIVLGIKGLDRILENRTFTESEASIKELEEYKMTSNPIVGFIAEMDEDQIINQPSTDVYNSYIAYCNDNKLSAVGRRQFVNQICKQMNLTSKQMRIQNERVQVLVRA